METKTYMGWLSEDDYGEGMDILYLSGYEEPFAWVLEDEIGYKQITAKYYTSPVEYTLDEARKSWLKVLDGLVEPNVGARYSEITGYLWTDEEINIGGHDLIEELHSFIGQWLILIIDIHKSQNENDR